ncbi:MAG: bifunctional 3-deoxy-7-phosphoheptulonate synthase/chorismate mutase [bacterium]
MKMQIKDINKLKRQVDFVDKDIVGLIHQRKELTDAILNIKNEIGIAYRDRNREKEIVKKLIDLYGSQNKNLIKKIYHLIFDNSLKKHCIEFNKREIKTIDDAFRLRPIIIAGPCAVESKEQIFKIAKELSEKGIKFLRGGAFKPRTSPDTFQGLGDMGVEYLSEAAKKYNMFIVTEALESGQLIRHYDKIDIVQVGSRNMASYGFLKEVGKITSKDKKPVLLKRGFNATLKELLLAAKYIQDEGNPNIILCLRGIRTFEQIDSKMRFTPDLASILELKEMTGLPVIFDPSHSTGNSQFVQKVSEAALNLGADGLLIETHYNPAKAMSDAEQCILPKVLFDILDIIEKN